MKVQKVSIKGWLWVFLSLMALFAEAQEKKSDITSTIMCMYAPWQEIGRVVSETTSLGDNHVGYAYVELSGFSGKNIEAYGQFFWEQKWWKLPLFIHAEYRGVAAASYYESTTYLGAAYCLYGKRGYVAFEPLFMWKQHSGVGGQFSIVGSWEWKRLLFEHYTDLWKAHRMTSTADLYSQSRLYLNVYKRFSIGVIGTLFYSFGSDPNSAAFFALKMEL